LLASGKTRGGKLLRGRGKGEKDPFLNPQNWGGIRRRMNTTSILALPEV